MRVECVIFYEVYYNGFIMKPLNVVYYEAIKRAKSFQFVYYESRKRKLKTRLIYEYRCDERLKN